MPLPGKSLVGFLDRDRAIDYLQKACITPDPTNIPALEAMWQAAQAQKGAAVASAGNPQVIALPAAADAHINALRAQWGHDPSLAWVAQGNYVQIELDPILAYQIHVVSERSTHHCGNFGTPPTLQQLLDTCLPLNPTPSDQVVFSGTPNSLHISARNLNFRLQQGGQLAQNAAGVIFGWALPFVHVVRFDNRYYLHNGFHRAYGARMAGATHIPCLLRDVHQPEEVGAVGAGAAFGMDLLRSADPPTVAHFARGDAVDVQLRSFTRALHISWFEYSVAEE